MTARTHFGSRFELFGERSFAILFILLLGVPALPLPTGGADDVFEIITVLLAAELIVGREEIWLPARWRSLELLRGRTRATQPPPTYRGSQAARAQPRSPSDSRRGTRA